MVEKVEQAMPSSGYHRYTDRYYTSPMLVEELLSHSILLTRTVAKNRTNSAAGQKKDLKNEVMACRKGNSYTTLAWRDKRQVRMRPRHKSQGRNLEKKHNTTTPETWVQWTGPIITVQVTQFPGSQ